MACIDINPWYSRRQDPLHRDYIAIDLDSSKIPTVSAPLERVELTADLSPDQFTIFNMLDRVKAKADLFRGVQDAKLKASNNQILKKLR